MPSILSLLLVLVFLCGCGPSRQPVPGAFKWFTYHSAADLAMAKRDFPQAEALYQAALDAAPASVVDAANSMTGLAEARAEQGKMKGLDALWAKAAALALDGPQIDTAVRAGLLKARARYFFLAGNDAKAEADNQAVIAMLKGMPVGFQRFSAGALVQLAELRDKQGRVDEADSFFQAARQALKPNRGDFLAPKLDMLERAVLFYGLRDLRDQQGRFLGELVQYGNPCLRKGASLELQGVLAMARACQNHARPMESAGFYEKAADIWAALFGGNDSGARDLRRRAAVLRAGGV